MATPKRRHKSALVPLCHPTSGFAFSTAIVRVWPEDRRLARPERPRHPGDGSLGCPNEAGTCGTKKRNELAQRIHHRPELASLEKKKKRAVVMWPAPLSLVDSSFGSPSLVTLI